jgi:16S rRNA (cytidine1402-2'-O)-methyltransferase
MPGTLFIVATPIGNLEDITARALRILREVALIAAEDTRRTAHLLSRYGITTPMTSLHEHNEARKTAPLIERLRSGDSVALVSDAGTPLISDPGETLIRSAIDAGIRVEPIPGPSAIVAALAASGYETQPFTFLGFPPARSKDRDDWMSRLISLEMTAVFFEAPHRIRRTLQEILERVGDVSVTVARELTKVHESLVRGPISIVLADPMLETGELTIVIDFGHKPERIGSKTTSDEDLAAELGLITETAKIRRRAAIKALAKKHGRRPNDVYQAIEKVLRSGK